MTETSSFEEAPQGIIFMFLSGDGKRFPFHKILFDKNPGQWAISGITINLQV